MPRLIDANALIERCKEIVGYEWNHKASPVSWADAYEQFADDVDAEPTVDAVEVVRCKDCKHYDNSEGICWCKLNSKFFPGGFDWHGFPEDGFCSYGERRTDDG